MSNLKDQTKKKKLCGNIKIAIPIAFIPWEGFRDRGRRMWLDIESRGRNRFYSFAPDIEQF